MAPDLLAVPVPAVSTERHTTMPLPSPFISGAFHFFMLPFQNIHDGYCIGSFLLLLCKINEISQSFPPLPNAETAGKGFSLICCLHASCHIIKIIVSPYLQYMSAIPSAAHGRPPHVPAQSFSLSASLPACGQCPVCCLPFFCRRRHPQRHAPDGA